MRDSRDPQQLGLFIFAIKSSEGCSIEQAADEADRRWPAQRAADAPFPPERADARHESGSR